MWFEVQLRSSMLQGSIIEVQEVKNSIGTFLCVQENNLGKSSILKTEADIIRVKFLVN